MPTSATMTGNPSIEFALVDPETPDAIRFRRAMEDEAERLYGDREGTIHDVSADPAEMRPPSGGFLVVRRDGSAIGGGGFKQLDGRTCEIKRMYLEPEWRGKGLSRALLEAIEAAARDAGYAVARLDTGDRQPSAKRLYDGAGYRRIGDYNGNPLARLWYEREL